MHWTATDYLLQWFDTETLNGWVLADGGNCAAYGTGCASVLQLNA